MKQSKSLGHPHVWLLCRHVLKYISFNVAVIIWEGKGLKQNSIEEYNSKTILIKFKIYEVIQWQWNKHYIVKKNRGRIKIFIWLT